MVRVTLWFSCSCFGISKCWKEYGEGSAYNAWKHRTPSISQTGRWRRRGMAYGNKFTCEIWMHVFLHSKNSNHSLSMLANISWNKKLRTCNIQGKIFMYQLYLHKYKKKQALQSQFATRIIFLKMYHPPYKGFCIMLMPTKQSEGEHTILLALFIHK